MTSVTDDVARANLSDEQLADLEQAFDAELLAALRAERAAHEATRAELSAVSGNLALALEGGANELDEARLEYSALHALNAQNFERANECQKDFDALKAHHEAERAKVAQLREAARCHTCGKQATCVGVYEGREPAEFGCDDCCGHGNEDGWCEHFDDDEPPALLAPQPPPTRDARSVPVWPSLLAKYGANMSPELRALCEARDAQGRAKYGMALTTFNGRDALTDALQEVLDLMAYMHQASIEASHEGRDVPGWFWPVHAIASDIESAIENAKGGA